MALGGKRRIAKTHKLHQHAERLEKDTHFNAEEIKALLVMHSRLTDIGPLDPSRFRPILYIVFGISDGIMLDLVFHSFDRDANGWISDDEWVRGLSIMLRGTMEQLVEFTYFVYDMNGDRSLAREELSHCLKGCFINGYGLEDDEIEEAERDIVEITMRKLDVDADGQITFPDFQEAVKKDPLMLQSIGVCLPSDQGKAVFLSLITDNYRSYSASYPKPTLTRRLGGRSTGHSHYGHSRQSHSNSNYRKSNKTGGLHHHMMGSMASSETSTASDMFARIKAEPLTLVTAD